MPPNYRPNKSAKALGVLRDNDALPLLTAFDVTELEHFLQLDDEPTDAGASDEGAAATPQLEWPNHAVALTEDEVTHLSARFDQHMKRAGLAYGFVRALLVPEEN